MKKKIFILGIIAISALLLLTGCRMGKNDWIPTIYAYGDTENITTDVNVKLDFWSNYVKNQEFGKVRKTYTLKNDSEEDANLALVAVENLAINAVENLAINTDLNVHYTEYYGCIHSDVPVAERLTKERADNAMHDYILVYDAKKSPSILFYAYHDYYIEPDENIRPMLKIVYDPAVTSIYYTASLHQDLYPEIKDNGDGTNTVVFDYKKLDPGLLNIFTYGAAPISYEVDRFTVKQGSISYVLKEIAKSGMYMHRDESMNFRHLYEGLSLPESIFNLYRTDHIYMTDSCENDIWYKLYDITIPAGEQVTVTVSRDLTGNYIELINEPDTGFNITEYTVGIADVSDIKIKDTDMGFDLKKGITSVTIDPTKEKYFCEFEATK